MLQPGSVSAGGSDLRKGSTYMYFEGHVQGFRRLLLTGVLAVALGATAFAGLSVSNAVNEASAYSQAIFCDPTNGGTLIPAGGRCVDGRRVKHRYVQASIGIGDGPGDYCAGAKQYSDGTGGNTMPFGCRPASTSWTQTGPRSLADSVLGYATIINTTGHSDFFSGLMQWYP